VASEQRKSPAVASGAPFFSPGSPRNRHYPLALASTGATLTTNTPTSSLASGSTASARPSCGPDEQPWFDYARRAAGAKLTMLEIACHRCDRRGRLSLELSLESKPMVKLLTRRTFRPVAYAALSTFVLVFWPLVVHADMVPSNVLQRVFNLRMGAVSGTGFTIEVDNREYLITAKHVIGSSAPSGTIEIFHDNKWVSGPYRLIQVEPEAVDIAVLALDQQLGAVLPVTLGMKGAFLSETVFFVGFPYGLSIEGGVVNSGYPLPLVKHGIIAAFFNQEGRPFIIDVINNPGFSGGPVVIAQNPQNPNIIGVVSGYRASVEPVFQQGQKNPDLSVQTNTGLLIAFEIDYAVKAIQKNPIGYLLH